MSRTMIGLAVAGVLIGAAFGALALRTTGTSGEGQEQGQTLIKPARVTGKPLIGGPFSLIDQTGKHVTDKDFRGKYMLVFFGYTNCPDICPAGLQVLAAALDKLGHRGDDIVPLFITVDPERDTPAKLAAYVKNFNPRLMGLTGSPSEIATAAKAYRVFYQKVPDESNPKNYSMDHSSIFYLMGKDGSLLAPLPYTTDVAQLTQAIDKALP